MRAIWKGAISFGLVNIPVGLYPATRSEGLKFRLLREKDGSPIQYKRVAEADGKEVPWEEIVKGFEVEKGEFVVLKEEDLEKVDVGATRVIDITDFVDLAEVDPIYFAKPYYILPEKGGEKAYTLLHQALKESGKIGISKVVIKTREHLAAVKAEPSGLVLELMHFAEEIVIPDAWKPVAKEKVRKQEMQMAKALIEGMSTRWDPEKYHDDYREAVYRLIEEKRAGKLSARKPAVVRPTKVIDLVSVLQESIAKTEAVRKKKGRAAKKPASRKKNAA